MKKTCIFCEAETDGKRALCDECEALRQVGCKSKSTKTVVHLLERYNLRHNRRLTYGQFVLLCYRIEERRRQNAKEKKKRNTEAV